VLLFALVAGTGTSSSTKFRFCFLEDCPLLGSLKTFGLLLLRLLEGSTVSVSFPLNKWLPFVSLIKYLSYHSTIIMQALSRGASLPCF